jgi:UDP-N-acetylmuramoyl-tripeptide--D-alanyl-D-alanine ligase
MLLDLRQIARITAGRLPAEHARRSVVGISIDSRTLQPGELFVPLRGERFDGHDFLMQAVRRGAAACLSEEVIAGLPVPVVLVNDTLAALGDLAAARRLQFAGPVVAITGSSGKTTTKEMLAAILEGTGPGLKTQGNFNNLVGLPLTLLRLSASDQWAVLEMGMSNRGEIARMAAIARPAIGIISNIGPAHLETLHGLDGVARAKGELFAALPAGGAAIINADDERVAGIPVANGVRRLYYGLSASAEVRGEAIVVRGNEISFRLLLADGAWPVTMTVPGRHNVHNALAAAAAAHAMGVAGEVIAQGLGNFRTTRGRMEAIPLADGMLLLEDSYNANPLSVKSALLTLDEVAEGGRRIAVLGDMLELGESAADWHRQTGQAAAPRVDHLLLLGAQAAELAAGARDAGLPEDRIRICQSHEEVIGVLQALLRPGDRILVKGSRGMRMDKIAAALLSDQAEK